MAAVKRYEAVEEAPCPAEAGEVLRSGTWATVRYARRIGRPITLILPDGTVVEEKAW